MRFLIFLASICVTSCTLWKQNLTAEEFPSTEKVATSEFFTEGNKKIYDSLSSIPGHNFFMEMKVKNVDIEYAWVVIDDESHLMEKTGEHLFWTTSPAMCRKDYDYHFMILHKTFKNLELLSFGSPEDPFSSKVNNFGKVNWLSKELKPIGDTLKIEEGKQGLTKFYIQNLKGPVTISELENKGIHTMYTINGMHFDPENDTLSCGDILHCTFFTTDFYNEEEEIILQIMDRNKKVISEKRIKRKDSDQSSGIMQN